MYKLEFIKHDQWGYISKDTDIPKPLYPLWDFFYDIDYFQDDFIEDLKNGHTTSSERCSLKMQNDTIVMGDTMALWQQDERITFTIKTNNLIAIFKQWKELAAAGAEKIIIYVDDEKVSIKSAEPE